MTDIIELPTDEEITEAFKNTNFGRTDYKQILIEGVEKTAIGYHNGWTLTQIIRRLGLGSASPNDMGANNLTQKGLDFIIKARAQLLQQGEAVALKVVKGEICYKSQSDDQSYGMWCPVSYDSEHGFGDNTLFYTTPPDTQQKLDKAREAFIKIKNTALHISDAEDIATQALKDIS